MKIQTKKKEVLKSWPKNLTAKEIREDMDNCASVIDSETNTYEELEEELKRRKLKP